MKYKQSTLYEHGEGQGTQRAACGCGTPGPGGPYSFSNKALAGLLIIITLILSKISMFKK